METPTTLGTNPQANGVTDHGKSTASEHARRSIEEARTSAGEFAALGNEMLRNSAARAQRLVHETSDHAAQYVQAKPLKALLIAAAAGAGIAMLAGVLGRSRHHSSHR